MKLFELFVKAKGIEGILTPDATFFACTRETYDSVQKEVTSHLHAPSNTEYSQLYVQEKCFASDGDTVEMWCQGTPEQMAWVQAHAHEMNESQVFSWCWEKRASEHFDANLAADVLTKLCDRLDTGVGAQLSALHADRHDFNRDLGSARYYIRQMRDVAQAKAKGEPTKENGSMRLRFAYENLVSVIRYAGYALSVEEVERLVRKHAQTLVKHPDSNYAKEGLDGCILHLQKERDRIDAILAETMQPA